MKVSSIVCTFNYGRFLGRCLESLLGQTLPKNQFEIIVVDDGSTDETPEVLRRYERNVSVLGQTNLGLTAASNAGLRAATGEYVIRVDADDELEPPGTGKAVGGSGPAPKGGSRLLRQVGARRGRWESAPNDSV